MDSAGASSPVDSSKSEKVLRSSVDKPLIKSTHSAEEAVATPDQTEKPTHLPPQRPMTRPRFFYSSKRVKEAVRRHLNSDPKLLGPITKPNTSKSLPEKRSRDSTLITPHTPAKKKTPPNLDNIPKELREWYEETMAKSRKIMISYLPLLFDNLMYCSYTLIECTSFPKEKLKVTPNIRALEIPDSHFDTYLELLQELVPEWIYEETTNGIPRVCLNNEILGKVPVRERLVNAN